MKAIPAITPAVKSAVMTVSARATPRQGGVKKGVKGIAEARIAGVGLNPSSRGGASFTG